MRLNRTTLPRLLSLAVALVLATAACSSTSVEGTGEVRGTADSGAVAADRSTPSSVGEDSVPPDDSTAPDTSSETGLDEADDHCDTVDPPSLGSQSGRVMFFATCGDPANPPYPVYRLGDSFELNARLTAMAEGLTGQERAANLFSWFEPEDNITVNAEVDDDGVALLQFSKDGRRWRPAASTSAQTMSFVDPLAATVFLFDEVEGIHRESLCFGELACDGVLSRGQFEQNLFINHGAIATPVCDLTGAWIHPDRCTVAGVAEAAQSSASLRIATVVNVAGDDTLNLRAGPDPEAIVVSGGDNRGLSGGTEIRALPVLAMADDGGLWQLVQPQSNDATSAGWVNRAFLSFEPTRSEILAQNLIDLANDPSADAVARLPFASTVSLGLGSELMVELDRSALTDPTSWDLDAEYFRAYSGPFSILEPLRRVERWQADEGPHDHCAGPPMPAPSGLSNHTIVSVQPLAATIDSCLQWFAVDLFVGDDGQIDAVTLDVWEP